MTLTEISQEGLNKGMGGLIFGATICPKCRLIFLDGIEGASNSKECDKCWESGL
jgi:hypothetical protein